MAISTDSILNALKAGVYTLETLSSDRFFKVEQPEIRRRYPSVELVEIQPQSNTATQKSVELVRRFEVKLYLRLRGGQVEGQTDEVDTAEVTESEILAVLEATVLGEHKITVEDKQWKRTTENAKYPPFLLSTLTLAVRQIQGLSDTPDGVLVFNRAGSLVDNPPVADYTYTQCYDTDIVEGYRDIDEFTNEDADPKRYTGGFAGTFIGHVRIKADDIGTTGDKLNQLNTIRSNGEKGKIRFIYTNKDQETPSPATVTKTLDLTVDNIQELYRTGDNTIFRILAKLITHSTTTAV